jgi:hypothetical protein
MEWCRQPESPPSEKRGERGSLSCGSVGQQKGGAPGFYRAELGEEASNAGPLPQTPIPADAGDGTERVCRILT